jgi:hypothetical protein
MIRLFPLGPLVLPCESIGVTRRVAMSKRFKGVLGADCSERPSVTADHVFARQFFLKVQRRDLLQVPACDKYNGEKAKLEHYLTPILPFGGQPADALANLCVMLQRRLAGNKKLHRKMAHAP